VNIAFIFLALVAAYLLGSVPAAYLMGRLRKGIDIRQVGSHNMGAMNVFYSVGFGEGMAVLAFDIGKGAAAVFLARVMGTPEIVQLLAGLMAVVGHNFPVFLNFKGGRGGATCIGILVFIMPWGIPFYLGAFLLVLAIMRYPTLSYSLAFVSFPFVAWLIYHRWEFIVFSVVLVLLPLIRYIPRIREMRAKGGSWGHVVYRKGIRDRL
jgi:glycerol-3-phosphate acyltransferase PlsY